MTRAAPALVLEDAIRRPSPRRGLSCAESADYIGVSITKFLEMVADGRMPPAKKIDRRRIWDIRRLDAAFDALDGDDNDGAFIRSAPLPGRKQIVL